MNEKDYRVKVKVLVKAMGYAVCLQRKAWWGWKTTAYYYPSNVESETKDTIETLLLMQERQNIPKDEKKIAMEIKEMFN